MKTRILSLVAVFMLCVVSVMAQSPKRFNYQAVVRDASNNPYTSQDVGIRFTILNSSLLTVYTETQSLTTNGLGLVVTLIGDGNPTAFDALEWGSDEFSLKIELDLGDNGSWETNETQSLNSVPYALHAKTADRVLGDSIWKKRGSDIYFNQGNTGLGVSNPLYPLHIVSNQVTGRDTMLYIQTADDPESALILGNGTISDGKFMPSIIGLNGSDHRQGLFMIAQTTDDLDDLAGHPLMSFNARKTDDAIINRPLFQWTNYASHKMTMLANGNLGIGTIVPTTKLHIVGGEDAALLEGSGYLQIGETNGPNLVFDNNELMSRNNGLISELYLQHDGGNLYIGRSSSSLVVKDDGNIGIGTSAPDSKVHIQGNGSWADEDPLFQVKNSDGVPVFAVYNNGVRILVEDDPDAKGRPRGGFSVGGFDRSVKGYTGTYDFMRIGPDSIRFNINNSAAKGPRGGFAVGGFDRSVKGTINEDFMYLTPGSSNNGIYNTLIGYDAGNNLTGDDNVFMGYASGAASTAVSNNVYIGKYSGRASDGSYNVFMGESAGEWNEGDYNVFIGYMAGRRTDPGMFHFPNPQSYNTAVGYFAGMVNTGQGLVAMGWSAGQFNRGDLNTFIGAESGRSNTDGESNTFIGCGAGFGNELGHSNVFLGTNAGSNIEDGFGNVFIGHDAGANVETQNRLYIDNSNTNTPLIWGDFSANLVRINGNLQYTGSISDVSDIRLKDNLEIIDNVLSKLDGINGYYFDWSKEAKENLILDDRKQIGVIAQEVEKVFPELVSENEEGYKVVNYVDLTPILLEAVKEQQSSIESMRNEIDELRQMVSALLMEEK